MDTDIEDDVDLMEYDSIEKFVIISFDSFRESFSTYVYERLRINIKETAVRLTLDDLMEYIELLEEPMPSYQRLARQDELFNRVLKREMKWEAHKLRSLAALSALKSEAPTEG